MKTPAIALLVATLVASPLVLASSAQAASFDYSQCAFVSESTYSKMPGGNTTVMGADSATVEAGGRVVIDVRANDVASKASILNALEGVSGSEGGTWAVESDKVVFTADTDAAPGDIVGTYTFWESYRSVDVCHLADRTRVEFDNGFNKHTARTGTVTVTVVPKPVAVTPAPVIKEPTLGTAPKAPVSEPKPTVGVPTAKLGTAVRVTEPAPKPVPKKALKVDNHRLVTPVVKTPQKAVKRPAVKVADSTAKKVVSKGVKPAVASPKAVAKAPTTGKGVTAYKVVSKPVKPAFGATIEDAGSPSSSVGSVRPTLIKGSAFELVGFTSVAIGAVR